MEKTLLISFIVPAFNAEATLAACVRSIVRAMSSCSYGYEIVIIDDGSVDETAQIARTLAEKYQDLVVLHQENKGLGAARNRGIEEARGRYIFFVDADDEVAVSSSPDFTLLDGYFDIIAIPILKLLPSGNVKPYGGRTQKIPLGRQFAFAKDYLRGRNVIPCVCAYLWRRESLTTRFAEGVFHEDEEFTIVSMLRGGALVCSSQLFSYYYIEREGSITTSHSNARKRMSDFASIINRLQSLARQNPEYKPYMRAKMLWLRFDYFRKKLSL